MASDLAKHTAMSIVLIETNGTIKTLKTKEVSNETLYKKCGFRVSDDFTCRHTWQVVMQTKVKLTKISWRLEKIFMLTVLRLMYVPSRIGLA